MSNAISKFCQISRLVAALGLIGASAHAAEVTEPPIPAAQSQEATQPVPAQPADPMSPASAAPAQAPAAAESPKMAEPASTPQEDKPVSAVSPEGKPQVTIIKASEKELKQQVSYVKMMMMGKSAKRIAGSGNAAAIAILDEIKTKVATAEQKLSAGDLDAAQQLLADSMKLFNTASNLVPSEDVLAQEKERYAKLTKDLETALSVYKRNYDRTLKSGAGKGVVYDKDKVNQLAAEADKLAEQNKFAEGGKLLVSARDLIDAATSQMMHKQELVYELKLDTPQDEYKYEHDQYLGYAELIPVAIENKQPGKGQMLLVSRHEEKARQMADEADKKAQAGEYPVAIRMIKDATEEVRKALKIMGVPLF